jgi:tetratricopeptide (TPR) repeat protein
MQWLCFVAVFLSWTCLFCESSPTKDTLQQKKTTTVLNDQPQQDLKDQETELFAKLDYVTKNFGPYSLERLETLDELGKFLYQQKRLDEVPKYGKEIVQIAVKVHGKDHQQTGIAFGNLASVYYKIGKLWESETAMNRALRIFIDAHGANSAQVVRHRAMMEKFGLYGRNDNEGISHEEYEDEMFA